jgi:hypothetical protein
MTSVSGTRAGILSSSFWTVARSFCAVLGGRGSATASGSSAGHGPGDRKQGYVAPRSGLITYFQCVLTISFGSFGSDMVPMSPAVLEAGSAIATSSKLRGCAQAMLARWGWAGLC